ncbi:MAG TPA: protein kinase [Streptosporangiaceae bacterium]|nr:protein kinase [Streptosporangiaceae bacterium]
MSARSGELLGPYRLRELLGEGGMGMVYLASGPDDRPVAVKVLRQGAPGEETARRRLAREVDTMRRVHSPFVAEVLDADVDGDPPYIVTQYVAGRTLEDVVAADGPLAGPSLASLACGLSAALAAIHTAGVVHRDLKPANVMLVDGEPVVIDFGIAQTPDSTRLTMTGMFMGTPGYLAPEVIEGGDSTAAADVHSLAATLAYAAIGRPPYGTGQFQAIFYRIVHGQPDLGTLPEPLRPIVLAGLARDPARRPTAADLAARIAALSPETLVPAPAGPVLAGSALAGAPSAYQPPWQLAQTSFDLPPAADAADLTLPPASRVKAPVAPAGLPPFAGTRPLAVPGQDGFGDLLPPVRYQPGAAPGRRAGPPASSDGRMAGAQPARSRPLLVLATMLGLIAVAVLLPVAGVAAVLGGLVLLRAADLTAGRVSRRRAGQGRPSTGWGDFVSAAAFYPWAIVRSALRFVVLSPMALLCGAVAAVLAVLATGSAQLPRDMSYAAGALVACYCLGPGSAACRRPLSTFYGRITRSAPAAMIGGIGVAAIAVALVGAALTAAPGYWPDVHLGHQLHSAATTHPAFVNVADVGRRLWHWLGTQFP